MSATRGGLRCRIGWHRLRFRGYVLPASFRFPGSREHALGLVCTRRGCSHVEDKARFNLERAPR